MKKTSLSQHQVRFFPPKALALDDVLPVWWITHIPLISEGGTTPSPCHDTEWNMQKMQKICMVTGLTLCELTVSSHTFDSKRSTELKSQVTKIKLTKHVWKENFIWFITEQ